MSKSGSLGSIGVRYGTTLVGILLVFLLAEAPFRPGGEKISVSAGTRRKGKGVGPSTRKSGGEQEGEGSGTPTVPGHRRRVEDSLARLPGEVGKPVPEEERAEDDASLGHGGDVADDAAESDGSASSLGLQGEDLDLDHARYWDVKAEWEHSLLIFPMLSQEF